MGHDNNVNAGIDKKQSKWEWLGKAPLPVRLRWGRFVAIKMGRDVGRTIARWRIRREQKRNHQALVAAHESVLFAYRGAERLKLTHTMSVYRVSLFLLTACRDIAVMKLDMLTSRDWWLRKLLARNVALLMYELDVNKVTGTQYRAAINFFAPPKQLQRELDSALDGLIAVQGKLRQEFEEIRQNTIAHRDGDAMRQYRLIRNIDELAITKRAGAFFRAADPVVKQIITLTEVAGGMPNMLNQIAGRKVFGRKRRGRK